MDPVSTAIIAAVLADVDELEKELLLEEDAEALVDAYDDLKEILKEKYTGESQLLEAVYLLEDEDTLLHRRRVQREVEIVEADEDPEIVEVAKALLAIISARPGGKEILANVTVE